MFILFQSPDTELDEFETYDQAVAARKNIIEDYSKEGIQLFEEDFSIQETK